MVADRDAVRRALGRGGPRLRRPARRATRARGARGGRELGRGHRGADPEPQPRRARDGLDVTRAGRARDDPLADPRTARHGEPRSPSARRAGRPAARLARRGARDGAHAPGSGAADRGRHPRPLLARRPDVRRAERSLAAETARIGVATADLYPDVSLSAAFGLDSTSGGDLFEKASRAWSIGPSLRWPIFTGGRTVARIAGQDARARRGGAVRPHRPRRARRSRTP